MEKRKKRPLYFAAVLCIISLAVMLVALLWSGEKKQNTFIPPEFEAAAQSGIPDVPEGLGWQELDVQVFKVSVCGVVAIKENTADVWLTNPKSNQVWLKLRVLDTDGNILGETGLLKPGEYVQSIVFNTALKSGTEIVLKVMAYEPEVYTSAGAVSLNTTIQ